MDYTLEEKYARIREDVLAAIGCDPVRIAHEIMRRDYINMHGPEHHFLDGAAFLAAYRNAGGEIDLDKSTDEFYKDNMRFTSAVIAKMGEIGGARCCKRNAYLSLSMGAAFVREKYGIPMEIAPIVCDDFARNGQCIGERCPFHPKGDLDI